MCNRCLLGEALAGALGDALGARYEGRPETEFVIPPQLDLTDNTQLTLATCAAIREEKAVRRPGVPPDLIPLLTDEQWVLRTIERFVETCCDDG